MKVIIASCVFPPEPVVSAKTSMDVAQYFHELGHEVIVACPTPSRNVSKTDADAKVASMTLPFLVKRLFAISSGKSGFLSRFVENISYGVSVLLFLLKQREVDIVYANVWPVFSLGLLVVACKIKGITVVASVQDLYPESLAAQKRLSDSGVIYRALFFLDSFVARHCDRIIVISDGFKMSYTQGRGISEDKVTVIRNWVKSNQVTVMDKALARTQLAAQTSIVLAEDDVVCVYGGNMGVASGLDELMSYVESVDSKIIFLLAGDGSLVPGLREMVQEKSLESRIKFLVPWPSELTSIAFGCADLLLLPIAAGQEFASVPSKLITYLLSARPILLLTNSRSESAIELQKSGAGFCVEERSGEAISSCLGSFISMSPEERLAMGRSGRVYAENFYSSDLALAKINTIFEGAA